MIDFGDFMLDTHLQYDQINLDKELIVKSWRSFFD